MVASVPMTNVDCYLTDSRLSSAPGYLPDLHLTPANGFIPQNFSPGMPDVRNVDSLRPSQNGTFDFTSYYGARPVALTLVLAPELVNGSTDQTLIDRLAPWMLPDCRPYLCIRKSPLDNYRRILLSSRNVANSFNFITKSAFTQVALSWKGIDGIFESVGTSPDPLSVTLNPGSGTESGRAYDMTYDRTYPASAVIGTNPAPNVGTAPVFPIVTIYGPCTQPRIANDTTGLKLEFLSSYVLNAGEYLLIDFKEGTVYLNGDPTNSKYDKIDFVSAVSNWWNLIPGANSLRFYPLSSSAPSAAVVTYRYGYLL